MSYLQGPIPRHGTKPSRVACPGTALQAVRFYQDLSSSIAALSLIYSRSTDCLRVKGTGMVLGLMTGVGGLGGHEQLLGPNNPEIPTPAMKAADWAKCNCEHRQDSRNKLFHHVTIESSENKLIRYFSSAAGGAMSSASSVQRRTSPPLVGHCASSRASCVRTRAHETP